MVDTAQDPRALWEAALSKAKTRDGNFTTISGSQIKPLYTPDDAGVHYNDDLGYPGQFPFTRGVHPSRCEWAPLHLNSFVHLHEVPGATVALIAAESRAVPSLAGRRCLCGLGEGFASSSKTALTMAGVNSFEPRP